MAKRIFNKRTLALALALVMCFSMFQVTVHAAPAGSGNWSYAYYLGQEYLGNAAGAAVKPDPVGYGFQGVITDLTFTDDAGTSWTFVWSSVANGEWRITGSNVSKAKATAWPQITTGKLYVGYCNGRAYTFTLEADGSAASWTYANTSSRHANWFYYIRFIREYVVNVFYQNETGGVTYNGVNYTAQDPLVRYFQFLYPNGNIIDDSEYEDGEYTDPVTLLPADYLPAEMIAQGYEIKYATDAQGNDVLTSGVTISLLGENTLNVYCTIIPPQTENYTVVHQYYTEGSYDGSQSGGTVEVEQNADFAQIVAGIAKQTSYNGNTYGYVGYEVDPAGKVITLTYSRELPTYDYRLTYNANFGANETKADAENITGTKATSHTMQVDSNEFSRANYTFTGWNTAANGSGTAYAAGNAIGFTAEDNSKVLYAQWAENPKYDYSVTYNANFGANETKADAENVAGTYAISHTIKVDENHFSRPNFDFLGWNTAADGSGTAYAADAVISLNVADNTAVLYAQWAEHPKYDYSVTYSANFGEEPQTLADIENITQTYAATHTIGVDANTFSRPNYTFVGWATQPNGEVVYQSGDEIHFAQGGSEVLYAKWIEHDKYSYTVIYNGNGGALEDSTLSYGDSENVSGIYGITHDISVDANTFARANYTFVGWNTAADGSGTAYAVGTDIHLTAEDNTRTLYAQWVEYPKYDYSLIYNANFGTNPETVADLENIAGTYAVSHLIGVDANTFTRENHTFLGWSETPDGDPSVLIGSMIQLTNVDNTKVLYAQWVEHPKYDYSVIYDANFGANETKADAENVSGTYKTAYNIGVDKNTFARENYTFLGWNTRRDGTGTAYAAEEIVALTSQNNEVVLYAQWSENPKYDYAVTYNANFGANETKGDAESISGIYATAHDVHVDGNSFVRENYTFAGWNTAANGTGTAYAAEDVIALTAEANTATLYAQWIENEKYDYSLVYNANFGAGETKADAENVTGTYAVSHTIGVDANGFVRENYTFAGWNTAADGSGTAYAAGDAVALTAQNNEAILYAQWIENEKYDYAVIYNANFGKTPETAEDAENASRIYETAYTIGVDANTFVRVNYTFIGWATQPDGEVVYQSGDKIHFTQGGSEVLYAKWVEHDKYSYTVIYNGNGGMLAEGGLSYGDSENIAETYATTAAIGVDANSFVRNNYTFIGWNTAADGSGRAYTAEESIALTAEANTATLYAQWAENPKYDYAVTYEANFEGAPESKQDAENVTGIYETAYSIKADENAFQRTGYAFIGWNTAADGSGTAYAAGDAIALTAEANTATLYAQWEIIQIDYTVEYEVRVDGGEYTPFQGELPEKAPEGGKVPHGTKVVEELENIPQELTDDDRTYDYTTIEETVNPDGSVTVTVYYTYITPEPPAEEESETPPTPPAPPAEEEPETPPTPPAPPAEEEPETPPTPPAPPAEEEPETPPAPPADPTGGDGLVDLPDEQVPLADAPKTGDAMMLYVGLTAMSGFGLIGLGIRKKEEEEE